MAESQFIPAAPAGSLSRGAIDAFGAGQSLMERASRQRREEERFKMEQEMLKRKMAEDIMLLPVKQAEAQADIAKLKTELDVATRTQQTRQSAYGLYDTAQSDFDYLNLITDAETRAQASREWLSRYSQLENVKELQPQIQAMNELATKNIASALGIAGLGTAEMQAFSALTKGMPEEDVEKARRVKLGLDGRASNAALKQNKATLPDGSEMDVIFNPRTGKWTTPEMEGASTASPTGGNPYVGPSTEKKASDTESGKIAAEKKAALPRRKAAVEKIETTTDRLIEDIDSAIAQVNAATAGPGGVILGAFPGTSARDLQSTLDTIVANIGFEALQAMRDASKTGGALGSITERELELLQSTLASFKVGQSPAQLVSNLKKARKRIAENAGAANRAFETEYGSDQQAVPAGIAELSTQSLEARREELLKRRKP